LPSFLFSQGVTTSFNFNSSTDLTNFNKFEGINGNVITYSSSGGISNTGAIDIPQGPLHNVNISVQRHYSAAVYTYKNSFDNSSVGNVYTSTGYFKNVDEDGGRGGFGITSTPNPTVSNFDYGNPFFDYGNPPVAIGVTFHGGGFDWVNDGVYENLNFSSFGGSNISGTNWYKIKLTITKLSASNYDMVFEVWRSDESGNIVDGTYFTKIKTVTNSTISASSNVYPYFSFTQDRFRKFDNFTITGPRFNYISLSNPVASLTSCSGSSSSPTSFGVTGSGLTASVTITAPSKFEISRTSDGSYSSSLTLNLSSTVSQTLYVRLNSSATFGINSGTISAISTGASEVTTEVSGTVLAKPTLSTSAISLCAEATYLITKTTVVSNNDSWIVSGIITVNNGYVTAGTTPGTYTVSYTDGCAQTASATVTVNNSDNGVTAITDGLASYKINNTNPIPQGPTASFYAGYNGFNYSSATRPTKPGFYKANNQSGNNAGCPFPFEIFRCTTCPD
jgi:hypothetical protein